MLLEMQQLPQYHMALTEFLRPLALEYSLLVAVEVEVAVVEEILVVAVAGRAVFLKRRFWFRLVQVWLSLLVLVVREAPLRLVQLGLGQRVAELTQSAAAAEGIRLEVPVVAEHLILEERILQSARCRVTAGQRGMVVLVEVVVEQHLAALPGFLSLEALAVLDARLCSTYSLTQVVAVAVAGQVVLLVVVVAVVVVLSEQIEMRPLPWVDRPILAEAVVGVVALPAQHQADHLEALAL